VDTWLWILIAIAAVVVVAAIAWSLSARRNRARRTEHLRNRFGPEYDRVVGDGTAGQRRQGEADLERREMRRAHLDIRPLAEPARRRYADEWTKIQQDFVDDPAGSVARAETLVAQVMDERGYPVRDDFENQAELVSVDHPDLVRNYRFAHEVYERSGRGEADTEELRSSLVYYRSLFGELLAPDRPAATTAPPST
jgi:hypothetical protein